MALSKHDITQIFLSVCDPANEVLSPAELILRIKKQHPSWFSDHKTYLADVGLAQLARGFCKRWDGETIDDDYLLNFPELASWEKTAAKKFQNKNAFLPSESAYKEVCKMSAQERVDSGNYGIQKGQETVQRFRTLKHWGLRGGGIDS